MVSYMQCLISVWGMNIAGGVCGHSDSNSCFLLASSDIQDDEMGMCAFLAYFLISGYQFQQAQAVVRKMVGDFLSYNLFRTHHWVILENEVLFAHYALPL